VPVGGCQVAEHFVGPREPLLDRDPHRVIGRLLAVCFLEDGAAIAVAGVPAADPAKARQRLGPFVAGAARRDRRLEQRDCAGRVTGIRPAVGRREQPPAPARVSVRRQLHRSHQQRRRPVGRAAGADAHGRLLELCRDPLVGTRRRERKMPRRFLGVGDDLGELLVQVPSARCAGVGVDDRSEERMREPEPVAVELDHPRRKRPLERRRVEGATGGGSQHVERRM
jgi:hypothetical protein